MNNHDGKADSGKPDYLLLDYKFLKGIVKVREYGVQKYSNKDSWKGVPNAEERYKKAVARHMIDYLDGKVTDEESGLETLDHILCNIMFLRYFESLTPLQHQRP